MFMIANLMNGQWLILRQMGYLLVQYHTVTRIYALQISWMAN